MQNFRIKLSEAEIRERESEKKNTSTKKQHWTHLCKYKLSYNFIQRHFRFERSGSFSYSAHSPVVTWFNGLLCHIYVSYFVWCAYVKMYARNGNDNIFSGFHVKIRNSMPHTTVRCRAQTIAWNTMEIVLVSNVSESDCFWNDPTFGSICNQL